MVPDNGQLLDYATLMTELQRLTKEGQTGAVMLFSADNRMAQINLVDGQIAFVFFRSKRGLDALPLIREIGKARMSFRPGVTPSIRVPLPPTAELLRYLSTPGTPLPSAGASDGMAEPTARPKPTASAAPVPTPTPARTPAPTPNRGSPPPAALGGDAAAHAEALETMLAEYLGPIAGLVCGEVLARDLGLDDAIEALAAEIPDDWRADEFRAAARQQLGGR